MLQIPMSDRRRIEAEALTQAYAVMAEELGRDKALEIIVETVQRAGRAAGRAFAAQAPEAPSLEHFATILDVWNSTGLLTLDNVVFEGNHFGFDVVRCGYAEMYLEMNLPEPLVGCLSCERDGPFAEGYSPRLKLDRPQTIASGGTACPFRFTWT